MTTSVDAVEAAESELLAWLTSNGTVRHRIIADLQAALDATP